MLAGPCARRARPCSGGLLARDPQLREIDQKCSVRPELAGSRRVGTRLSARRHQARSLHGVTHSRSYDFGLLRVRLEDEVDAGEVGNALCERTCMSDEPLLARPAIGLAARDARSNGLARRTEADNTYAVRTCGADDGS